MFDIFQNTTRPDSELFFHKNDVNDVRLGEIVSMQPEQYAASNTVILGCPQDEGVARNKGRVGAALAPDAIRRQFYKLSDFGISCKIFDLGNTVIQTNLEKIHELHSRIVEQILRDGKRLIVLGGGNDISYADGTAVAKVFGTNNWQAFNIDAHFDVRADFPRNSGTPYRQLLEEKHLHPHNFCQTAFQYQSNSKIHFDYLRDSGVRCISLEEIQTSNLNIHIQKHLPAFWGFDTDSVRAADAPGVSASSPLGLTAAEFVKLAETAAEFEKTKLIEFTEANPNFDLDDRTVKLIAFAMHAFCRKLKKG